MSVDEKNSEAVCPSPVNEVILSLISKGEAND
jgi:hypothetical protein